MILAIKHIRYPVSYISHGQYIDGSDGKMIADVRGWGWIQKLDNPELIQVAFYFKSLSIFGVDRTVSCGNHLLHCLRDKPNTG